MERRSKVSKIKISVLVYWERYSTFYDLSCILSVIVHMLSWCHWCVQLSSWPEAAASQMTFTLYPIQFPDHSAKTWRELFKLCASQRIFIPVSGTMNVSVSFQRVDMLQRVKQKKVASWEFCRYFSCSLEFYMNLLFIYGVYMGVFSHIYT